MSNSEKVEEKTGITVTKSEPKLTPPGYQIQLSTKQAVAVAELVDSPVFKILEKVYAAQRKDHIARVSLNSAQTETQIGYYKGMAAEVTLFFQNMKAVKKALSKDDDKE